MRDRSGGGRLRPPTDIAWRPRFEWTPFHQRIAPTAERWDVNIDPIIPPVDGFRLERKVAALVRGQRGGKQARIFTLKNMFVVKDERFIKFNKFFGAGEIAFRFGQWRFLDSKFFREAIDAGDHRLLHRNRKPLIALLGNRNCFKFQLEPVFDSLLGSVMPAVRKASEFDATAHVTRINTGSR